MIIFASGLFLLLDQFLKWQATHNHPQPRLINAYLGWEPFINQGIAFGLPLSNWLIILLTIPMIILVGYLLLKSCREQKLFLLLGWSLILMGAISNLIDRLIYGYVVDYLAVLTGVINIGDVMIVAGLAIYLLALKTKKQYVP